MLMPWFTANFEELPEESKLQPGDVLLFPLQNKPVFLAQIFKHAAVYCGDEEIIHFQNTNDHANGGQICKEGLHATLKKRGKCQTYRKKAGVDLDAFQKKVRKVMNSTAQYSLTGNNCIHFALYLLGLSDFYSEAVKIKKNDSRGSRVPCNDPERPCYMF
ncbi:uncharacterized protein [Anas platyrhynchos]|uniref:uncharacterized protein isoform X10 n=1 Tax=Anas platyrhynchos TaxID=8839 RepID=UPI003AF2AFED